MLIERIVAYKDRFEIHRRDGSVTYLKRVLCRYGGDEGISALQLNHDEITWKMSKMLKDLFELLDIK
ncbi:MAG: hypothetical protein ACPLYF_02695 [Fervidobacterium sp.]